MKGMGGHKHHDHTSHSSKILDSKMANLELENEKLRKEIDDLSSMIKKES
jgi:cell division protein FtsB